MYKKMLRLLSIVLAVAVLAGLVACGGAATPAPEEAVEKPADTPIPEPVKEKRVLKIWHYEGADAATSISWDDAMKDFEASHPDVTIEFERKTFDQIQQTGQMILNSPEAPDVMQINKGNATAGLYAKQGLLTDMTDVAKERGWDKILSPSIQTTCRYDENGIMGSGPLYGVTDYGEFVMVYYNKDMFKEYGVEVPTTLDEFNAVAETFLENDITPIALGTLDKWPVTQNFYELALYKADRKFIDDFELLKGDVDFHGPEFTYAAEEFLRQVEKGYYGASASGVSYDDANAAFVQGKFPMTLTGSWRFGTMLSSIEDFEWGIFVMPGKTLNTGSGGNLWIVPQNAENKDLAFDFIDLTLQPKAQTIMANEGGIPVNADLSKITDPHVKELNAAFNTIVQNDGLAFYPDWPAPGYMDTLGGGLQDLMNGAKTPSEFLDFIAGPWQEYKDSL